jgi:LmbE family N-acetylglucosaminyl deacetylase
MIEVERVLVLAPHADDGELGCGGTVSRLVEQGCQIRHAVFSICEASVPEGFAKDVLATEVREANRVLGIDPSCLIMHRYPVRHFPEYRQEILDDLIQIRDEFEPELVFLPSSDDVHQDHKTIYQEGVRAFKQIAMLGYELPWNNLNFTASTLVHLEERHVRRKIAALRQYESQQHRSYRERDFIFGLARVRGVQAGATYAEAFQAIRWIVR